MLLLPWMLILLAVPLHGYDVMMVIGGRYYDHARQAYIELATVEVNLFNNLFHVISSFDPQPRPLTFLGQPISKNFGGFFSEKYYTPTCLIFRLSGQTMFAHCLTSQNPGEHQKNAIFI